MKGALFCVVQIYILKIVLCIYDYAHENLVVYTLEKMSCHIEEQIVNQFQRVCISCFEKTDTMNLISRVASMKDISSGKVLGWLYKMIATCITIVTLVGIVPPMYIPLFIAPVLGAIGAYKGCIKSSSAKNKLQDDSCVGKYFS